MRATDGAGNTGPAATVTWTVDTRAPTATLVGKPGDPSNDAAPSFSFTSDEPNTSFSCNLDATAETACTSPRSYQGLTGGSHTFTVRPTDAAGNTGASVTYTWTLDLAPPTVTISSGPASPTNSTSASFAFTASEADTSFSCSLDTIAAGCTSPRSYSNLANGPHTLQISATDRAGNTGPPTTWNWTIDVTPPPQPTIDSAPPTLTRSPAAAFAFSTTEAGATFRCALDAGAPAACASPKSYASLADGVHTFHVTALDALGNESAATSFTWTVDTTAPTTTLTSTPANPAGTASASFGFTASEAGVTFTCSLDGATPSPCSSPAAYGGLADGSHTFSAVATDAAGNTGAAAGFSWSIDTSPVPTPTITSAPPATTPSATATLSFSDTRSGVTFRCRLDGGAFSTCTSPKTYSGLADGAHSFDVVGRSASGVESDPASASWTVDTVAPAVTLTSPGSGSVSGNPSVTLSGAAGSAAGDVATVTVRIYAGTTTTGTPVQTLTATRYETWWSATVSQPLAEGTYTARAEQSDAVAHLGVSSANTFAIDLTPPAVTLATPTAGATTSEKPTFSGTASVAPSDSATVDISIYAGTSASGTPGQVLSTSGSTGTYSIAVTVALPQGTYTAQAAQQDAVGNVGRSASVTFTVSPTPYRDSVLADAPSGYWRLADTAGTTAADTTGANAGTYEGGVTLGAAGVLGTESNLAASFDGVNDDVTVPNSSSLSATTGVTVETWVKRSKSGWQVLVAKPGNATSKFENYAIWINSTNYVVAYFGDGTNFVSMTTPTTLDTNWHLLDATYDNATARLYVDGVQKASVASTIRLTANTQPLNIGKTVSNNNYFGGQQDEVAIYKTALSATRIAAHYNAAFDTATPVVTVTSPAAGTLTDDTTPHLAGMAGTTSRDSSTVTVKLYAGSSATGTPIQTLTTTRYATGTWDVEAGAVSPGTYTTQAVQTDTAGNVGRSVAMTFTVGSFASSSDPVVVSAGDIAACNSSGAQATGLLLDQFPNATVISVGDHAYPAGTSSDFANCYDPYWGRAKSRTRPTLGPHDYGDVAHGSAAGYMAYFGDALAQFGASATDPNRAYYSFDLGTWHIVMVNTGCNDYAPACDPNAMEQWLRADLAAHPTQCSIAVWHNPRFSSGGQHGSNVSEQRWFQAFYDYGGDVVLNGEDHIYERFAPQDANGFYAAGGPREFIVGTGGAQHYLIGTVVSNSEIRNGDTFGLLQLRLHPSGYDWKFIPEAGKTFTDSGTGSCH